jgi:hypothetical protein
MNQLNFLSVATVPLQVLSPSGAICGIATGFFYRGQANNVYLVTNWHVVTGRHPTNPNFSKYGAVPCTLRCKLHKNIDRNSTIDLRQIIQVDVSINTDDGDNPEWLEHHIHRHLVDVVAIKMDNIDDLKSTCTFHMINDYKNFETRFEPSVMDHATVIGYPWGLTGGNAALPLYKRGSIASEPKLNFGNLPRMLIDCRTTQAMSGSPVIVSRSGVWNPDGKLSGNSIIGQVSNFVGIYSGRLFAKDSSELAGDEEISEIGIVWKKETVDAVTAAGVPGTTLTQISHL